MKTKEEILRNRGVHYTFALTETVTVDSAHKAMQQYADLQLAEYKEKLKLEFKQVNLFFSKGITVTAILELIDTTVI